MGVYADRIKVAFMSSAAEFSALRMISTVTGSMAIELAAVVTVVPSLG
jgi:hypothetical protein